MPTHQMSIYQRPAQGGMNGQFLASYDVTGYSHRIRAWGGFDTASALIRTTSGGAENILSNYIGCVVRMTVDNAQEVIWEGLITRITYRVGGAVYTRSMDDMTNRTRVSYYDANAATPNTQLTAVVNNTTSQAIYGIKTGTIEADVHYNSANITHLTTLRDTVNLNAYPLISSASASASGDGIIEVEMQGLYYYVFEWNNYTSTDTTLTNAGVLFTRLTVGVDRSDNASGVIEDTTSYAATADALITTNATFQMSRESRTGQTYLQFIQSIVEAGDGSQQWVWGVTGFDPNTGTRRAYYRPATTTLTYTYQALQDIGRVRDIYGGIVPGWKVRPDSVIQVTDILNFWSEAGDDPRFGYILAVEYDGDSGLVTWQTGDNPTVEGAIGTNKYFRRHGGRLNNAPVRQVR